MEEITKAGILTGISMMPVRMPIPPGLCDTDENLEATIRCAAPAGPWRQVRHRRRLDLSRPAA